MTIYEYLNISEEEYKFKRDYIENPLKRLPRKGGGIEYEKPFDEDLKYMFIDLNLPIYKINQIIGHKISDYLAKFKKKKYMSCPKLSKEELIELYCKKHKTLRELADMFGYKSTIIFDNIEKVCYFIKKTRICYEITVQIYKTRIIIIR